MTDSKASSFSPLLSCCKLILVLTFGQWLLGCASFSSAPKLVSGPLVGQIFTSEGARLAEHELIDQMLAADVIFLGEKHDNPRQHALQQRVIQILLERGKKPAIGMEMIFTDRTSAAMTYAQRLDGPQEKTQTQADAWLRAKLGWTDEDDFEWLNYGAIVQTARKNKLPLFGIDLPSALRDRISKIGVAALTPLERAMLPTLSHDDETYRELMYDTFKGAHCGWGPDNHLRKLYDNWNARNDKMASAIALMASIPENRPVVVIVGSGHTQYNRGVIASLSALNPELKALNLGLMGVHEAMNQPADYSTEYEFNGVNFGYPHDYLWFTEGTPDDEDLCKYFLNKKEKEKDKEKEQDQLNEEIKNQAEEPQDGAPAS